MSESLVESAVALGLRRGFSIIAIIDVTHQVALMKGHIFRYVSVLRSLFATNCHLVIQESCLLRFLARF